MRRLLQFAYLALSLGVVPGDAAWRFNPLEDLEMEGKKSGELERDDIVTHGSGQSLKDSWEYLIFQEFMYWIYMCVSENSGTQQPWVFLLKMIILGCFGGTAIYGNTHIYLFFETPSLSESTRFNGRCGGAPMRVANQERVPTATWFSLKIRCCFNWKLKGFEQL